MHDLITQVLALPGLVWVLSITFVAGIVYGFAGFGAALVYMPVATRFLPVEMAIAAFSISALVSLFTVVPRAWGQAERRPVMFMIAVALVTLPIGIYVLKTNDVTTMRWAVLAVTTITLIALVAGWRYETKPSYGARVLVAGATGLVGGATGLVGPIMVLFQLGGQDNVARSRANTLVFLTLSSLFGLPMLALQGLLSTEAVALGFVLMLPYGIASRIGQALFDPARQSLYRMVAYAIIAMAVLLGLPLFG